MKNAFAVLVPGRHPFYIVYKPRSMDIDMFHDRTCHLSEPILRESARQQGITLTDRMKPCNSCLPARGQRVPVANRSGGRVESDLAPDGVLAIDLCGPFTPSLGRNLYMFYGVDHATGYIVNYSLRRKSEALAVFKRCVVDMAHKAGTAVKCVRGDCDALWTSRGFVESMGIAREHSPPGSQQYNGVAESAI